MTNFGTYQSPFSWRYASDAMRGIWSEHHKRLLWRKIWVALATVQAEYGLVSLDQVAELQAHAEAIDLDRAFALEAELQHDLMAEVKTYAEQCPTAGGCIHIGATSMDIEDNADAMRLQQALDVILEKLKGLLLVLAEKMITHADLPVMAYTHIQPAEPTTLGYRLAFYAQDVLESWQQLQALRERVRGKGFKGAVGTGASYAELIGVTQLAEFEQKLSSKLNLPFYAIATQTYPRRQDYDIISALAGLGACLHKLAFDLRLLQSPPFGELAEPFGKKQVGSSAMPFKRNPIRAEKIDSLARQLAVLPQVAWQNAATSLLERTLDDSANRRTILPEAFLITDELLMTSGHILSNLVVNHSQIERNFATYAPFACTERILMAAARHGADRQAMHEHLRTLALAAWAYVQRGEANPLINLLREDALIRQYIPLQDLDALTRVETYLGIAPSQTRKLAANIQNQFSA